MKSKILFQRPNKLRIGTYKSGCFVICKNDISKKLNGNEYAIDGDTLYLKPFTENRWIIISEIDYRDNFIVQIQAELSSYNIFFDLTEIFKKEGIL